MLSSHFPNYLSFQIPVLQDLVDVLVLKFTIYIVYQSKNTQIKLTVFR